MKTEMEMEIESFGVTESEPTSTAAATSSNAAAGHLFDLEARLGGFEAASLLLEVEIKFLEANTIRYDTKHEVKQVSVELSSRVWASIKGAICGQFETEEVRLEIWD